MGRLVRIFCEITPGERCNSLRGMRFRAHPARDAFRFGVCVSGHARREIHSASEHAFLGVPAGEGITLRGMRFWALPPGKASRFGTWVSGHARRGMYLASGDGYQGVPAGGCISLRGMGIRACPPGDAFRFGACISGPPGVGCILLRGMVFWARPAWETFRFGACVSRHARRGSHHASGHAFLGVARRGKHFASRYAFQGAPGVGGISLRGMHFRACPAWDAFRFGACVSRHARREMHFALGDAFQETKKFKAISFKPRSLLFPYGKRIRTSVYCSYAIGEIAHCCRTKNISLLPPLTLSLSHNSLDKYPRTSSSSISTPRTHYPTHDLCRPC